MPTNLLTMAALSAALQGRFDLEHEVGIGGQGIVYKGIRRKTQSGEDAADVVALKVHLDPAQDQRADREIRVMEGMRHPNLANLIEHGMVTVAGRDCKFAAWEFIDGKSLEAHILIGPVPAKIVCAVGRDVCTAVDQLWTQERIVHRDVNPKNVMLRVGDREAVLIDLGIAKHRLQTPITGPQITWGTPGYFSPEQAYAQQNLTVASDVFSLGITLQEALLGRHPTGGDQAPLLNGGIRTSTLMPAVPAALADLMDRMCAGRPAFRPSPKVLADAFAHLVRVL